VTEISIYGWGKKDFQITKAKIEIKEYVPFAVLAFQN
jgi:hypothetical protein